LTGAGQEVALSVSVSCFHCRDQQAVPWCTLGGEWLRGPPSVWSQEAENRDLFWAAPCGKRDDDRSKVTAFRVRVRAWGLENDAGLRDLVSHKQAVKLGSIIVVYCVVHWIQEYRRRVEAKGSKRRFSETSAAMKQGGKRSACQGWKGPTTCEVHRSMVM